MTDYSNPEQREEKTLLEIVAYQLFKHDRQKERAETKSTATDSGIRIPSDVEIWQANAADGLRSSYRAAANSFIGELNDAGLKVSVKKAAAAEQAINAMAIIPARKAYDFTQE